MKISKTFKVLLISFLGIVTLVLFIFFGYKAIFEHHNKIEIKTNQLVQTNFKSVKSTLVDFGFKQLNRDRAETNVIYFNLDDNNSYFINEPSLKSYFLSLNWIKNLRKGDTLTINFLNDHTKESSNKEIPIIELFYNDIQYVYKETYVNTKVREEKHWLEKTVLNFPNFILIIILIAGFYMIWIAKTLEIGTFKRNK